jgi:hypothetical protein
MLELGRRSDVKRKRQSLSLQVRASRACTTREPQPSRARSSLRRRRGNTFKSDYIENCQRPRFRPYCPLSNVNTPEPIRHGTKRVIGVSCRAMCLI